MLSWNLRSETTHDSSEVSEDMVANGQAGAVRTRPGPGAPAHACRLRSTAGTPSLDADKVRQTVALAANALQHPTNYTILKRS